MTDPAPTRWALASLFAAALTPLLIVSPALMERKVIPQDEGQLLIYPSLMLKGIHPNSDFVYTYGVSNLWSLVTAFKVFGQSVQVERMVGLAFRVILVIVVVDIVRRTSGMIVALAAGWTCTMILAVEGAQSFAWISAVSVAILAVWAAANLSTKWPVLDRFLPWFLAGFAISYRLDVALAVVGAVSLVQWSRQERTSPFIVALGLLTGLTPTWAHFLTADNVVADTITGPILNSGGRRLPLVPQDRVLAFSTLLLAAAFVVVIAVLWFHRSDRPTSEYVNLIGLGSFSILVVPQIVQRMDTTHFVYVGSLIVPSAIAAGSYLFRNVDREAASWPIVRTAAAVVTVIAFVGLVFGLMPLLKPVVRQTSSVYLWKEQRPSRVVEHRSRWVPVATTDADDLGALLESASSLFQPGSCERLFVGPRDLRFAWYGDTFIYFMLDEYVPATRYLEFNPGGANASDSRLADELRSADVVILNSDWDDTTLIGALSGSVERWAGPSMPNELIANDFESVGSYGSWTLLTVPRCAPESEQQQS